MAWIESHQNLREHPKTITMCELLGAERPQVVGHLHLLWWWCIDYAPDGDLSKFTPGQIARAAEWSGDPKAFSNALVTSGFVERTDDKAFIHDWHEYCGALIERRLKRLAAKRPPLGAERPPTQPNPTIPNPTQPKDSYVPPPEAVELTNRIKDGMLLNNPKAKIPKDLTPWLKEADKVFRLDKKSKDEALHLASWCQRDSFWKCNILSVPKFREKYDQLLMKMKNGGNNGQQRSNRVVGSAAPIPGKYDHLS